MYTLLPSKEADSEELNCMLTCLGFSEWCPSAPAVAYKPEAGSTPGPECVQAFLEVRAAMEQVQQISSVSCPDGGCLLARRRGLRSLPSGDGSCAGTPRAV